MQYNVGSDCQISALNYIYNKYFSNIKSGFFVEVGAYDGMSWSNTFFLAGAGWQGIYIEPVQEQAEKCRNNHKDNNVIVEQCAIGSSSSLKEIFVSDALSTIDPRTKKAHDVIFGSSVENKQPVVIVTLDSILKKHNVRNNFELLVVDTEGYEREVFNGFSLIEYRPKMIIVELCDMHNSFNAYADLQQNAKETRNHIEENNYIPVYIDAINTVFVDGMHA